MASIYKYDDTGFGGDDWLTITLSNPSSVPITKAVFQCGNIRKEFTSPNFPLKINLDSRETALLKKENQCYLAVYDNQGRKRTCQGTLKFNATDEVVDD